MLFELVSNGFFHTPFEVEFLFSDFDSGFALNTSSHFSTFRISPNVGLTYLITVHGLALFH